MVDIVWVFVTMIAVLAVTGLLRWPLPIGLILSAVAGALIAGFGIPFRHLVEGGFGYLNLILALFAGAFFGQVLRQSGAADAIADMTAGPQRRLIPLAVAGVPLFLTGMLTGIAGVAVLTAGTFAAAVLQRAGLPPARSAAYIALMGTLGMIAPPLNVPAMVMADGVNMPFAGFAASLLALSLPCAVFALLTFARHAEQAPPAAPAETSPQGSPRVRATLGIISILGIVLFWSVIRYWPALAFDPSIPLVLVIGGLSGLFMLSGRGWSEVARQVFSGTPLMLAAVLVAVGVLVQIMALTGVRGWIVINVMSFQSPWNYAALAGLPLLGSVLTSIGVSNALGVPFAFAFIHQDMILNISALSALAALSEFCPPTAISTALAAYVVGTDRLWPIIRAALPTLACLTALAVLMLILNPILAPYLR
jgi:TRAP-type C4-dicarboxylate transport system permease large subunit